MPKNHQQPTKEEIEAEIKAAQDALANPPSPSPAPETPQEDPAVPTPSPSPEEPSPSKEEEKDPVPSPSPSPEEPSPSKELFKKKFKNSTREALVQKAGRDNLAKAIKTADGIPEPTEEELIAENPDWDVMSETERKTAKKLMISDRRWEIVNRANKESEDLDAWIKKVEDYVDDPKIMSAYPGLEGKEEEFRTFSITPSRRGIPLEDLVKVFLFDATKAPIKKKGKMFELPGGGHTNENKQVDKYSPQEAERLREKDFDAYKTYIKKHRKAIQSGAAIV